MTLTDKDLRHEDAGKPIDAVLWRDIPARRLHEAHRAPVVLFCRDGQCFVLKSKWLQPKVGTVIDEPQSVQA